jgi:hypothetical protein
VDTKAASTPNQNEHRWIYGRRSAFCVITIVVMYAIKFELQTFPSAAGKSSHALS